MGIDFVEQVRKIGLRTVEWLTLGVNGCAEIWGVDFVLPSTQPVSPEKTWNWLALQTCRPYPCLHASFILFQHQKIAFNFRSVTNDRKAVAIVQGVLIYPNQVSLGSHMGMLVHSIYQTVSWCCHGNTESVPCSSHVPTRLPFALNCCVSRAGLLLADTVLSCLSVFGAGVTGKSLGHAFILLL